MRLWDTIKKPFKWWHEFLQRHKSFRGIWWFIKGGGIIILFLFLFGWFVEIAPIHILEDLWGYIILLGVVILGLIVDPVGTLDELFSGGGFVIFIVILCVVIGLGPFFYRWIRGARFRRRKKLDEEEDKTPVSTSEYVEVVV